MDKMKVGLLTFHNTSNFGAVLQTISTVWALESLGCDCTIIDYCNEGINNRENPYLMYSGKGIKTAVNKLIRRPKQIRKFESLTEYVRRNAKLTQHIDKDHLEELNEEFDLFLVGSDMLWNLNYTKDDYSYFLDFVSSPWKKVSFATSAGIEWEGDNREKIGAYLKDFAHIAVRERGLAQKASELTGRDIKCVCDPTMLIDNEKWISESCNGKKIDKKYYLIYMDDSDANCYKSARRIAEKDNVFLYEVAFKPVFKRKCGVKYIEAYTIADFLSLIKNASMIFTASYHGMLFSIYFHVPMRYVNKDGMRIKNVAEYFGLEQCDASNDSELCVIDWNDVDRKREEFKVYSKQVLASMIFDNRENG